MFVNKNVKSLKNVNKTKHHKRNKNKKRSIKKLSIKYMRGGSSNTSGASGAIIHIPTLLELIQRQSKDGTMCEIHYDDVKIICLLGNDNVKLGYDNTTKEECISIIYNAEKDNEKNYNNAIMPSFFYNMSKQNCLYSSRDKSKADKSLIDNSVFYNNKGAINYSKSINTLLLELVDTINILLGVKYCQLIDDATVNCNESGGIKLSLNFKHITKGYGFYNEFGYLYTKSIVIDIFDINAQNEKYKLLDLKFANNILTMIYNAQDLYKDVFTNLEETCKMNLKDHPKYDETELYNKIQVCNANFITFSTTIIKTVTDNIVNPSDNKLDLSYLFKTFIKRYEYLIDDTVSKSELLTTPNPIQDPLQETPYHFAMVKYTKPTITITSLQEAQLQLSHNLDKPPKPLYSITITKGTKIE